MKNLKKIVCIFCALLMVLSMFAGCSKKDTNTEQGNSQGLLAAGEISVSELKVKYGEKDDNKILPLYNLDCNTPLEISLKYTPTNEKEVFSIHTDIKCLDESKVDLFISPSNYNANGPKTYEVKPVMAPLSNSTTQGLWGNVSNYYIKFNYDITAETETKLAEPTIVPMSILSPVEIPNTSYDVTDGNFTLRWSKVEGATSYKIYQRQVIKLLETTNIAPSGKEEAYKGTFPMLVKEVSADTFYYNDWLGNGQGGMSPTNSSDVVGGKLISYQNQGVNGEYYVTAVINGKESLFSESVNTTTLNLPKELKGENNISLLTFENADSLPKTLNVTYVNGTQHAHNVSYESKDGEKNVTFRVEGTNLIGVVYLKTVKEALKPEASNENTQTGFVNVENNIPQNAPTDVPTINDAKTESKTESVPMPPIKEPTVEKPSDTTPPIDEPDEPDTETPEPDNNENDSAVKDKTLIEQQIENTEKVVEQGNKEKVTVSKDTVVFAESAAEEYIALSLIAGKNDISISAFPEIQSWSVLCDVLQKVVYQNPLIIGVKSYAYNYGSMTLIIEYDFTVSEIQERQEAIKKEGKKIIEQIITTDMDEAQKRRAIYSYLEDNTSYDDAALESAENNNYQEVDKKFRDSFNTYGILVKKVGVCQSYAMAYDYLCELADVECIVVTGNMLGYLPHAWNKVKVDGEWLTIDVTNNEKNVGINDLMYENPDQVAYAFGYIEDDMYYDNDSVGEYTGKTTKYSKYKTCIVEDKSALVKYIKDNAKPNTNVELLATYEDFDSNDVSETLYEMEITNLGSSIVMCGYVYFEVK